MTTTYTQIKMTADKSKGQFVKTLKGEMGVGCTAGTHVHKDWWAKTLPYESVRCQIEDERRERRDLTVPRNQISGKVLGDSFVFGVGEQVFTPNSWSLAQFGNKFNVAGGFLKSLFPRDESETDEVDEDYYPPDKQDAETLSVVVNNALRKMEFDKKYLLRTYTDGTLRAVLTEKYKCIDNRWYLDTLHKILPEARFSHWKGNCDTIWGNLLLPDSILSYPDDDSDYGGMVSVSNCEIGKRVFSVRPSIFRSICMNGCIWGKVEGVEFSRRHRGNIEIDELEFELRKSIEEQIPLVRDGVTRLLASRIKGNDGVDLKPIVANLAYQELLSKKAATKVLSQWQTFESDNRNLFGLVNSVTRAGQVLTNESWVKLDEIGGKLIYWDNEQWENFLRQAKKLDAKKVNAKFLGI